jgi:hypothetical protein
MAYSVDTFSGSRTFIVEDGTVNTSLDIRLVGKNYAGYGEIQNENFLHLLENFAGVSAPPRPLNGQIWYDSSSKKIKFWDSASAVWRGTEGIDIASSTPPPSSEGRLWWNTSSEQLLAYNGSEWVLIGPQSLSGYAKTIFEPIVVTDILNIDHAILVAFVAGEVMYVVSKDDEFFLSPQSQQLLGGVNSFSLIKPGITLTNTNNQTGTTSNNRIIWGTSSSSKNLTGGVLGQIPYQTAINTTDFVEPNFSTTKKVLSQTGNGTQTSAPEWATMTLSITTRSGSIVNITIN